jgi:hypothetical protein
VLYYFLFLKFILMNNQSRFNKAVNSTAKKSAQAAKETHTTIEYCQVRPWTGRNPSPDKLGLYSTGNVANGSKGLWCEIPRDSPRFEVLQPGRWGFFKIVRTAGVPVGSAHLVADAIIFPEFIKNGDSRGGITLYAKPEFDGIADPVRLQGPDRPFKWLPPFSGEMSQSSWDTFYRMFEATLDHYGLRKEQQEAVIGHAVMLVEELTAALAESTVSCEHRFTTKGMSVTLYRNYIWRGQAVRHEVHSVKTEDSFASHTQKWVRESLLRTEAHRAEFGKLSAESAKALTDLWVSAFAAATSELEAAQTAWQPTLADLPMVEWPKGTEGCAAITYNTLLGLPASEVVTLKGEEYSLVGMLANGKYLLVPMSAPVLPVHVE